VVYEDWHAGRGIWEDREEILIYVQIFYVYEVRRGDNETMTPRPKYTLSTP
jgi:hypothetical protein